jgi:hypothetical protein
MAMSFTHTNLPGGIVAVKVADNTGNPIPADEILFTGSDNGAVVALTWNNDTSSLYVEGTGVGSATITVNTVNADFAGGGVSGNFGATVVGAADPTEYTVTLASGTITIL